MLTQPTFFGATVPVAMPALPRAPRPYPGASPELAAVLQAITRLAAGDQSDLARAFRAVATARRPAKPKRIAADKTFRDYDDFSPAFAASRALAREAGGPRWYLNPDLCLKARLPIVWANCKILNGTATKHGPRDVNFPVARFWPGETLPVGPEYVAIGPIDPECDIRRSDERRAARRAAMLAEMPELATLGRPGLELECPPDGEIEVPAMECV